MAPSLLGYCPRCGKRIYHDSRFVRDELNIWCPDHAPATARETPFEETVPHVIPDAVLGTSIREECEKPADPDFYIDGEPFTLPQNGQCVRCKLRVPMQGADFCEWCAKDQDFDFEAVKRHEIVLSTLIAGACGACEKKIDRGGPRYHCMRHDYHASCAYRISKEARDERGRKMDAAMHAMGMPKDCTLFPPDGAKIVMNRPVRSDKWAAAERLARLVLGMDKSSTVHDLAGMKIRFVHDTYLPEMVAEARRVLGEAS